MPDTTCAAFAKAMAEGRAAVSGPQRRRERSGSTSDTAQPRRSEEQSVRQTCWCSKVFGRSNSPPKIKTRRRRCGFRRGHSNSDRRASEPGIFRCEAFERCIDRLLFRSCETDRGRTLLQCENLRPQHTCVRDSNKTEALLRLCDEKKPRPVGRAMHVRSL